MIRADTRKITAAFLLRSSTPKTAIKRPRERSIGASTVTLPVTKAATAKTTVRSANILLIPFNILSPQQLSFLITHHHRSLHHLHRNYRSRSFDAHHYNSLNDPFHLENVALTTILKSQMR